MAYQPNPDLYKIRVCVSQKTRTALLAEQGRRQAQTGIKTNLMDIASEWLDVLAIEKAPVSIAVGG